MLLFNFSHLWGPIRLMLEIFFGEVSTTLETLSVTILTLEGNRLFPLRKILSGTPSIFVSRLCLSEVAGTISVLSTSTCLPSTPALVLG